MTHKPSHTGPLEGHMRPLIVPKGKGRNDAATRRRNAVAFLMKDASPAAQAAHAAGVKAKRLSDRKAWWEKNKS